MRLAAPTPAAEAPPGILWGLGTTGSSSPIKETSELI